MDFNNGGDWNNNHPNGNSGDSWNNEQRNENNGDSWNSQNNGNDQNNQSNNNDWNSQSNNNNWNNQNNNNGWNNQNNTGWNNNQSGGNGWNNGGNGNNWGGWQNQTPPPIQRQPVFINGILNRPILKNEAKAFLRARYGILLAATIIPGLIAFGIACIPVIGAILDMIFAPVLYVGAFYLIIGIIRNKNYDLGNMFDIFGSFGNIFGATFTTNLFIYLWGLIAVIPVGIYIGVTGLSSEILKYTFGYNYGFPRMLYNIAFTGGMIIMLLIAIICYIPAIYKSFCWAMVPYILADNPQMTGTQARRISNDMMRGHKCEYFVFLLSYIGWFLLSACTFGILGFLYVNPYLVTANCDYYDNLRMLYEAQHQAPDCTNNTGAF